MRRFLTLVALVPLATMLTGFTRGMHVRVRGTIDEPVFAFTRAGPFPGRPASVDSLSVSEVSGGALSSVWTISRDPTCAPATPVRYGAASQSWRVIKAPAPLRPGATYVLIASGCGFHGGVAFKFKDGVVISRQGSGDAPRREVEKL